MSASTGTLGKLMAVVDIVCQADAPMRFTDILQASNEPRGTLHRHLSHLVEEGLLEIAPDGAYQAGLRILKFASKTWNNHQIRQIAAPFLRELHEISGETVHFGFLNGNEIIYVDKVEGRQSVRMHSNIGKVSPLHCTGVGKAVLSILPPVHLENTLSAMTFTRFTQSTLSDPASLLAELELIRKQGYAFDLEEHEPGICCVAAPVRSASGAFAAAISVSAPAFRITPGDLAAWSDSVCRIAKMVESEIPLRLGPLPSQKIL